MVTSSRLGVLGEKENFGVPRGAVPGAEPRLEPREARKDFAAGVDGAVVVEEVEGGMEVEVEVEVDVPFAPKFKSGSRAAQTTESSAG